METQCTPSDCENLANTTIRASWHKNFETQPPTNAKEPHLRYHGRAGEQRESIANLQRATEVNRPHVHHLEARSPSSGSYSLDSVGTQSTGESTRQEKIRPRDPANHRSSVMGSARNNRSRSRARARARAQQEELAALQVVWRHFGDRLGNCHEIYSHAHLSYLQLENDPHESEQNRQRQDRICNVVFAHCNTLWEQWTELDRQVKELRPSHVSIREVVAATPEQSHPSEPELRALQRVNGQAARPSRRQRRDEGTSSSQYQLKRRGNQKDEETVRLMTYYHYLQARAHHLAILRSRLGQEQRTASSAEQASQIDQALADIESSHGVYLEGVRKTQENIEKLGRKRTAELEHDDLNSRRDSSPGPSPPPAKRPALGPGHDDMES